MMVIDSGRVVALDSPAGLVRSIGSDHTLRFRPSSPVDDSELGALPEVSTVQQDGPYVVVTGTENVVQIVATHLTHRGVVAGDLRVDQSTLEDAYLALTRTHSGSGEDEEVS